MVSLHALPHLLIFMTINKNNIAFELGKLPSPPQKVCVALSGGADSVCLLHILKQVFNGTDVLLSAVHINHCLRGDESDGDEAFCVKLCGDLNLPIEVHKIDVLGMAKKGESTELAARRIRYEIFSKIDADYIATAHNANDSLETFLINFSRGTGLKGLIGIPAVRDRFIRPLIKCSRDEIMEYIKQNNLTYVTDSTNLTDAYTRNKFRHKVIEPLKEITPEIVNIATRNMEQLKLDNDFIEDAALNLYNQVYMQGKGLKTDALLLAHKAISARVLIKYVKSLTNRAPDSFHINLMLDICQKKNAAEQLFDGYIAKVNKGYLSVDNTLDYKFDVNTEVLTANDFKNQLKINNLLLKNAIDYDKIVGKLIIRTRLVGDRLRPLGRGVSKPLRKLQNELGVEKQLRDVAPIAADDNGAFWGYGLGIDERMSIDESTKNILVFYVKEQKTGENKNANEK